MPQGDREQKPDRVQFALECRRSGLSYTDTLKSISETFGVSRSTAAKAMAELQARIKAELAHRLPHVALKEAERLERVAQSAEDVGEYMASVTASDKLLKLAGAYAPQQVEVTAKRTPEELDQLREQLKAKWIAEAETSTLVRVLEERGWKCTAPDEAEIVNG